MERAQEVISVVLHGDCSALQNILDRGEALGGVADEEGSTPLMYAAANDRDAMIRLLLQPKNGVDVNEQNVYGWTALMQAACYGHLSSVVLLLQNGAAVNLRNSWGATAIVGAAQGGFSTVVQVLLDKDAEVNTSEVVDSVTPLMAASQCGHAEVASELLKGGANVNVRLKATGLTPLMLAVLNNQVAVVKLLLGHGADKEMTDINCRTAAQLATALGCVGVVSLLVKEKPIEFSNADIFEAAKTGDVERVGEVLAFKRTLVSLRDKDGATPLIFAANKGHREVCLALLNAGADVNAQDSVHGWTALMQATHQRRHAVARLLGERGAQVNVRGKSGSTAFDIANMIGDIEMIRITANISMESVQRNRSTGEPASSSPTFEPSPTSPPFQVLEDTLDAIVEGDEPVTSPRRQDNSLASIDPKELTKRLQKAYRAPETPTIELPCTGGSTASEDKTSFPMPMGRVRSNPRVPISASYSSDSSAAFREPSPSSSSSSKASSFGEQQFPKSSARAAGGGREQQFLRPSGAVQPKFLSTSGPKPANRLGSSPLNKHPIVSPQSSSKFMAGAGKPSWEERELPSFLQKYPGVSRDLSRSPRLVGRGGPSARSPLQRLGGQRSLEPENRLIGMRERSQTDPVGQRRRKITPPVGSLQPSHKRGTSLKQVSPKADMKAILERASLGKYHTLFQEQEVDYCSFVMLSGQDLEELGISRAEDRRKLLSLIAKINSQPSTPQSGVSPDLHSPQTPVFVFQ